MPPEAARAAAPRVVSSLDSRIEAATGHDIDTLWADRDRGVLDAAHAGLIDRHRELVDAERGVTFYRTLLNRLSSGEYPVESALFMRIRRTVDQLERAADDRDRATHRVHEALELLETATRRQTGGEHTALSTADQAALLAIADGAKLYEHLLTSRRSVATASGIRITHADLQRLQRAGLVEVDTGRPIHAGQTVTLTDGGRAALAARRSRTTPTVTPVSRPGVWPAGPASGADARKAR
ncbi:hypothetical protein GCM10010095_19880 [Streptomyces anthocyanicus]|uniref:hypothetical protein n=1 Tax=Streptomyces anthocyanicus TaxID=68174 RepID=UPI00166F8B0C|nr:hypothetical protein [Streptomyces anthocyanicus]GGL34598.1 hypothetical protein GCM10010095_19880 [Streptomyces anthocyanicus]